MKKRLFAVSVMLICVSILASTTLAYFTAEEEVHNVITSGAVDIQLEEWQKTDAGIVPYPDEKPTVMPGTVLSKIPTVKNLEAEAYIRARFDVEFTLKNVPEGQAPEIPEDIVTVNIDTTKWVRKDGDSDWWYYVDPVATGESTAPLFTEVTFAGEEMDNLYQNADIAVNVYAQAVQTANNGASALEAAGWSES